MTTAQVHVVVPEGIDDPTRPSGGNVYDRRARPGADPVGVVGGGAPGHRHPGRCPGRCPGVAARRRGRAGRRAGRRRSAQAVLAEADRLRLVVLLHMPFGERDVEASVAEGRVLTAATAVVTTSEWSRRWVRRPLRAARRAGVTSPRPGVDPADLADGKRAGGELLCVAAVTPDKGHDVLLAALAEVADLPWHLTCVGSLDRDRALVDAAAAAMRPSSASPTGSPGPAHCRRARSTRPTPRPTCWCWPPARESWGMVVTESLARGLPVLATEVGGLPEALGSTAAGGRPACWCRPTTRRDGLGRCAAGCSTRRSGTTACGRPRASYDAGRLAGHRRTGRAGARGGGPMSRRTWARVRLVAGAAILLVAGLAAGQRTVPRRAAHGRRPRARSSPPLIAVGTTACCAWRWSVVVRGMGVGLPLRDGGRGVLPLAVPQLHPARRRAGRRPPRRAPRP